MTLRLGPSPFPATVPWPSTPDPSPPSRAPLASDKGGRARRRFFGIDELMSARPTPECSAGVLLRGLPATTESARPAQGARSAARHVAARVDTPVAGLSAPRSPFHAVAQMAYRHYAPLLESALGGMVALAGDLGEVDGRAKRPASAANRLERVVGNGWATRIASTREAVSHLWDAIGTRLVLDNPTRERVDLFVDRVAHAILEGRLSVKQVHSLTGHGGVPYFTEADLSRLQSAASAVGKPIGVASRRYDTGYTIGAIYVEYQGGVGGEIQLIGPQVLAVAEKEHLVYDAFLGKPAPGDGFHEVRQAARSLTESQREAYLGYLNQNYIHARQAELGGPLARAVRPAGIPLALDMDSLAIALHASGEAL